MIRYCSGCFGWLIFAVFASAVQAAERAEQLAVIPLPASVAAGSGTFTVEQDTLLLVSGGAEVEAVAHYFGDLLYRSKGLRPAVTPAAGGEPPKKVIHFSLLAGGARSAEAYELDVSGKGIVVSASDPRGLRYGAITLWQLLTATGGREESVRVAGVRIIDEPRLPWRGLLLDSAQQYLPVPLILQLVDSMALHKLNVLHWHLADDNAWRAEIKAYPRLTAAPGTRFYTQEEIRSVVAHGSARGVRIVPGIDVPARMTAATLAYPQLGAAAAAQGSRSAASGALNADESTFRFIDDVLGEFAQLFPDEHVHIGASRPDPQAWRNSVSVQARMRELGLIDENRMYGYYIRRIEEAAARRGRRITGWDALPGASPANTAVVISENGLDGALVAAASGYDVVVSARQLDFGRVQSAIHDGTPGRSGVVSIEDAYRFEPAPAALSTTDRQRIIGVQAHVWTSPTVPADQVSALAFPRAAALAEVAWSPAAQRSWSGFLDRMVTQLQRYRTLGMSYSDDAFRVAMIPRGPIVGGKVPLELSKQVGIGEIRYTTNGSEPTSRSQVYLDIIDVTLPVTLKAAVFRNGTPLSATMTLALDTANVAALASEANTR